jgi:hypothetical protein
MHCLSHLLVAEFIGTELLVAAVVSGTTAGRLSNTNIGRALC